MRTGDIVFNHPTGEEWVVAYVKKREAWSVKNSPLRCQACKAPGAVQLAVYEAEKQNAGIVLCTDCLALMTDAELP